MSLKASSGYKIFLVEDDETIANAVKMRLEKADFLVYCVEDFSDILKPFKTIQPHIALLDITLPINNGYHWCNEIRKISTTPILFLSSASDNINQIMAINLGADGFIAKPFDFDLLLANIKAILRRVYDFEHKNLDISFGELQLDVRAANVEYKGSRIELTKNEFRIMQYLMENPKQVISRDMFMRRLWENESFIDDNTLTVNINRLRKKLAQIGATSCIQTRKGLGYQLEAQQ